MNIDKMIDWYVNQIRNLKSNQLASIYNYFNMKGSYGLSELLPYCETTMAKILNPKNCRCTSFIDIIENYEHTLDRDNCQYGLPTYGYDNDAYVKVYYLDGDIHKISHFLYYTYGLEGDDDLIDFIAKDLTRLSKDTVEFFEKATGVHIKLYEDGE